MAGYAPSSIFQAFVRAGFTQAEAIILTATSFFESSYGAQAGNGGGLLQFIPSTWQSTGVTCPISDLSCQAQAAKALVNQHGGVFPTVWLTAWFLPEANSPAHRTADDYVAQIGQLEQSLGTGNTGAASSVASWAQQAAPTGPTYQQAGGAITSAVTSVVSGPLNAIGSGIAGAAGSIGKAVLPWIVILGIGFFALVMLGRELGARPSTVVTQAPANRGPSAGRAGSTSTAAEAAEAAA